MKIWKTIIKLIGVLLIPLIFQVLGFLVIGIVQGFKSVYNNADLLQDTTQLTESLAEYIIKATPVILLISSILTIIVFYLVHLGKNKKSMIESYRFNKIEGKKFLLIIFLGFLASLFSIGFTSLIDVESFDAETVEMLSNLISGSTVLIIISVGIVAPIAEEVVFRGSILKNLSNHMPNEKAVKWAVIIQAVMFSLYHMNLVQALPTLFIGLIMGFAVVYTNSIWSGIIIHIINNVLAIVLSKTLPETFIISNVSAVVIILVTASLIFVIMKKLYMTKKDWLIEKEVKEELIIIEDYI